MSQPSTTRESRGSEGAVILGRSTGLEAGQQQRASAYGLIAGLLRSPPTASLLEHLSSLDGGGRADPLSASMSMLGLAARTSESGPVDDEFHDLFIGLGRGELVPYASWYLTGFLMEKPLGLLRDDLTALGICRGPQTREPEDHIAALCEVMSMLINEETDFTVQSKFFGSHIATWAERFFDDLSAARSAVFYRALGRFGSAFLAFEQRYFSMQV